MMKRFVLGLCAVAMTVSLRAQQSEPIVFMEKTFDFGQILETGGNADHEFVFTNNSNRPIRILSVQASCGCTTPGWSRDPVQPGSTGFVKASFNPKGRPGHFSKTLTVATDVDSNPIVLSIKGDVDDGKDPMVAGKIEFPTAFGSLRFKFNSFPLGKVSINKPAVSKDFLFINGGPKPVAFTGKNSMPAYIKVETPKSVASGEKGVIRITYDARARNQYGFVSDNVMIETDDADQPDKSFSVFATLEEYFPLLTPDAAAKAPVMQLAVSALDFGRIREGNVFEQEVAIRNTGKSDLLIRAIQPNCTCVVTSFPAKSIKAGAESMLKISFTTAGRTGIQQKAITIYSNDPKNPVQRITLSGFVEKQ